jgi:hypothetical protein
MNEESEVGHTISTYRTRLKKNPGRPSKRNDGFFIYFLSISIMSLAQPKK